MYWIFLVRVQKKVASLMIQQVVLFASREFAQSQIDFAPLQPILRFRQTAIVDRPGIAVMHDEFVLFADHGANLKQIRLFPWLVSYKQRAAAVGLSCLIQLAMDVKAMRDDVVVDEQLLVQT